MTQRKFWIIWSPQGDRPPNYRHEHESVARHEAHRLAALHPGKEFFVMEAVGVARKVDVVYTRIDGKYLGDDIPF